MRPTLFFLLLFFSRLGWAQEKFEVMEFTGKVVSIDPGPSFAFSRIAMNVDGDTEHFVFHPAYGKLFFERIRIGDLVSVKVNVNTRSRKLYKELSPANKALSWYLNRDQITEIRIGSEWISIKYPQDNQARPLYKVFLDKKVVATYSLDEIPKALILENELVAFNYWISKHFGNLGSNTFGDSISFIGHKMRYEEGYQYPVEGVKEVYWLSKLNREKAQLKSFLFKQNFVCIGAKFKTPDGRELTLSFPTEKAIEIKKFLNPDKNVKVYFGEEYNTGKFNLPELHAIVQEKDTLRITQIGFYGAADGKHDHVPVEFGGKISNISKTPKGSVQSIIVGGEFYMEIDAMMAQQFGHMLEKGKRIAVQGKERVKKVGEIYSKNYRIVTPEKLTIDGTTFSAYKP